MRKIIREYLIFNRRERNGIIVLLSIIIIEIIYLNFSYLLYTPPSIDYTVFETELKKMEEQHSAKHTINASHNRVIEAEVAPVQYFSFNPNDLSVEEWRRLGLTSRQIQTIKNYEAKGGKFYKKSDLQKIYGISASQYQQLKKYIDIPESQSNNIITNVVSKKNTKLVELNVADSMQLIAIQGIGPYFARTILYYRKQLSGFYSKQQLLEIPQITPEKFSQIEKYFSVDTNQITKININTCTDKQLKHPYLKWSQVNTIIKYRNKHGYYRDIDDIKNTSVIDDSTYNKIIHYLTL